MGYAIFLCANACSVAAGIVVGNQSALNEILVDSLFDMFAAVLYPILVLFYSANSFDFDRELFSINVEVLPAGSFECNARLFADPAERALFITSLNSLRILTFADLVLRLSMNFSFCLRFITVINLMVETAQTQKIRQSPWEALAQQFHQQRRVPKPVAAAFVAFGAAIVVYTQRSISISQTACSPYPECVAFAYQWGSGELCPCRTFVDVYRTPQTLKEWAEPIDVSETVNALSRAGMLQNLQLINRGLTRWPEGLRTCKNLQYLSLIYTETEELPEWAKDWTNLQFLLIEGKQLRPSLTYLPVELFSDMPYLQMIHIGAHAKLLSIPRLLGVPNLQSLTLAALYSVTEIPSFERVPKLQHLALPYMEALQTLPDMTPLQNLIDFSIFSITPVCCNGFMGKCDPADWFCVGNPMIDVPPSVCLGEGSPRPSVASQEVFKKFAPSLCLRSGFDIARTVDFLTPSMIEVCDGVSYRRCEYPPQSGRFGICMNNRLQVLMCMVNDDYIRLRQVQIQRKVGPPCDAIEEAWLGCG
ncbi:uncharacterized protein KRP23_6809 [Phytophthora ramorum]|uniref:uncharacterized protein n=1 Tax=Phytophthora ramorum TaxID=164328 RepID=UPI00309F76D8|nr:hypothetical protein KRP23_6809 [Phytophthora ramorum]